MDRLADGDDRAPEGRLGSSGLMDRLHQVRKRKRAYARGHQPANGEQLGDADVIRRLLMEKRRSSRGG